MPAYNFQKRWANRVRRHLKRQTIRAKRKNRPRVGQTAYCFTGMRTKKCQRLGAWKIRRVGDVRILEQGVLLDGGPVQSFDLDKFARLDGFGSWRWMRLWFSETHGLPFHGDLVMW